MDFVLSRHMVRVPGSLIWIRKAWPWPQLIGHRMGTIHGYQAGPMSCSPGRLEQILRNSSFTWLLSSTGELQAPVMQATATLCLVSGVQERPVYDEREELAPSRRLPVLLEGLQALDLPLTELSLQL